MSKNRVLMSPCCKVKVGAKVKGRGQGYGSRSKSNFWHTVVNIRGSVLLSAAKSNNPKFGAKKGHYQSVFVCVSAIKAWMRSISF